MFQLSKSSNNISSILGPEVEINGDVNVSGDLIIYGVVNGDILSKGEVVSAKGSVVNGNICANNASLSGTVKGNLEIESKVILGKSSHVAGNLKAAIITIEEGAKFDGMCNMIHDSAQSKSSQNTSTSNESI
tara:strand:- start:210 stop:605 length:396 start_codon:yes stop_codon:yes gene_type:complete